MVVQAVRTASKEQKVVRSFHASLPLPSPHISALATSTYYTVHGLFMHSVTFTRTTVLSALFLVFELLLGYDRASKNSELETPLKTSDIGEINI